MKIDRTVPYIDFYMRRPPLPPPSMPELPAGYSFALYKEGDMRSWAEIEASVGEFETVEAAEQYFTENYSPYPELLARRMLFIVSPENERVATASAWLMKTERGELPFMHWIAVKPEFQSLGLGRAIIYRNVKLLFSIYGESEMWLHTQINSHRAVGVYRSAGFEICVPRDIPNDMTNEKLKLINAYLYAKNALYSGGKTMIYNVITAQTADFAAAEVAAIANYRWFDDYAPAARARLVYVEGKGIAARLECDEENPRAVYKNFYDPVYKDSCLEFFFCFQKGGAYVNCEMNSAGASLIQYGEERGGRTPIDKLIAPPRINAGREGKTWFVEVMFTLSDLKKLFGEVSLGRGSVFYGNFYKCGDETEHEHYGMWSPVTTERPDFHRPEFFGEFHIV